MDRQAEHVDRGVEEFGVDPVPEERGGAIGFDEVPEVFAKLDCKPRWRERLPELATPALVVHGRHDPFFPVGNGEALARDIPRARLLVLEHAATAIPDAAAGEDAAAMLAL
jgi:pimeloyl-ACP methyl ester carboxylesterase